LTGHAATGFRLAAIFVAAAALLAGGWLFWLSQQDALDALPQADGRLVFEQERQILSDGRIERHMIFRDARLGRVGVTISVPQAITGNAMPVVVVLGGFREGRDNIAPFGDIGGTVLIGYDWPLSQKAFDGDTLAALSPDMRRRALGVPGQVRAIFDWLDGQSWADTSQVSLVGYSLGAVIAPSVQRVLQHGGHNVGWTVLANGGAGLGAMVAEMPSLHPVWARPLFGAAADWLLAPLEPAAHLPHLEGRFLVLSWPEGSLPAKAVADFQALVPTDKSLVLRTLEAQDNARPAASLLAQSVDAARGWLMAEQAIPSPDAPATLHSIQLESRLETSLEVTRPEVVPAAMRE
jgi:hypothetical protein